MPEMFRLFLTLWLTFIFASPLEAVDQSGLRNIRLISESNRLSPVDRSAVVAIDIELEPNWKTYWRSPGRYGLPLKFTVVDSINVANVLPLWPSPTRYIDNSFPSLSTIGYKERLVLPLQLALQQNGQETKIVLDVSFGICYDACIPVTERIELWLSIGEQKPSVDSKLIREWLSRVPTRDLPRQFRIAAISHPDNLDKLFIATCYSGSHTKLDVFIEDAQNNSFAEPLELVKQSGVFRLYAATANVPLSPITRGVAPKTGTPITLTFVSKDHAYEYSGLVGSLLPRIGEFCIDYSG